MSAQATLAAAQACARTLLFDSLHIQRFVGAIPHVMLVVDQHPCTLQKVLVEGYCRVMDEWNGLPPSSAAEEALRLPLPASTPVPLGSSGLQLNEKARVSYSIAPFVASEFMEDMKRLQVFLRQCGRGGECGASGQQALKYLQPLPPAACVEAGKLCQQLLSGPSRELLVFILIQRSAFQNELQQYRLRLSLFDRGMRVVEHCHLDSMSEKADELARESPQYALADDQIFSYCRSCAFSPLVAEPLAKGIAEAIDYHAWARGDTGAPSSLPPPSLAAAMGVKGIWECYDPQIFTYNGASGAKLSEGMTKEDYQRHMNAPVTGVGAPLEIICRDQSKKLAFTGGMEDCLANTGFYAAAVSPERNDVTAHRERFRVEAEEEAEPEVAAPKPLEEVRGRMKKKEYLEMLRQKGLKPNKPAPQDERGDEGMSRLGEETGSRISSSIGGTFPIGEVISESFDLSKLNGVCDVFAYPDTSKNVAFAKPQPFQLTIDAGRVVHVSGGAPRDFVDLWTLVKQTEKDCYVRELGIGLNPYVGPKHVLADVTSFERQWGVHLSLGLRHPLFVKQSGKCNPDGSKAEAVAISGPVVKRKAGKYHIDVFVDAHSLRCGGFEINFHMPVLVG